MTATVTDSMPQTKNTLPPRLTAQPKTALRRTLPGEYLSLGLFCLGLMAAVWWLAHVVRDAWAVVPAVAGLWMAARVMGWQSGRRWTIGVTSTLIAALVLIRAAEVSTAPEWLQHTVIGFAALAVCLLVVLIVDVWDVWASEPLSELPRVTRRRRLGLRLLLIVGAIVAVWVVAYPAVATVNALAQPDTGKPQLDRMTFPQLVSLRGAEVFATSWFIALGANFGSFLNVVAWRMPRGVSVVSSRSRCPGCGSAISGKDNIPLIGWFRLGGQCPSCAMPISSRYVIVESIAAGIFLLLFLIELISGGANLPVRGINSYRGVVWIIFYAKWDLIGLYLDHGFLCLSLLTLALFQLDKQAVPRRLRVFLLLVTVGAFVIAPHLALFPVAPLTLCADWKSRLPFVHSGVWVAAGAAMGLCVAWLRSLVDSRRRDELASEFRAERLIWCLIGISLGWQSVLSIALLMIVLERFRNWPWPDAGNVLVATLVHLIIWRATWLWLPDVWPGPETGGAGFAVSTIVLFAIHRRQTVFSAIRR